MPSLIDIRRRIRSVKNTQQITKAMKMVSAAKLRRAQERVLAARPYARTLEEMLGHVALAVQGDESAQNHPLLARREEKRVQLVLFTSDRGLAGAFNANLFKAAQAFLRQQAVPQVEIEAVGRKGRDFFRRRRFTISGEHIGLFNKPQYSHAKAIAERVMERYQTEQVDAVYLIVNEFKSVLSADLRIRKLLPVQLPESSSPNDYIFEQPPALLLGMLMPRYIEVEIWQAILESSAAEHAARMTAMDAASSNASDVIDKLTLYMNRVRQASITKEIIEIVSGAAALE
jgi:F-type H+-transporting ATPase subunit gamma